jgi:hypothetical protein
LGDRLISVKSAVQFLPVVGGSSPVGDRCGEIGSLVPSSLSADKVSAFVRNRIAGVFEVPRFSSIKFSGVPGVFDYAGLNRNSR